MNMTETIAVAVTAAVVSLLLVLSYFCRNHGRHAYSGRQHPGRRAPFGVDETYVVELARMNAEARQEQTRLLTAVSTGRHHRPAPMDSPTLVYAVRRAA